MYYPRFRPENRQRSDNWHQNRTHRTRSEDYSSHEQPNDDDVKPSTDLVEETLRRIRSRRPSETMSTTAASNGDVDNRRLSCDEIDQVLNHIRSRSQSLSSRPPPPKASPPPLPNEEASYANFDVRNTPFGNVRSSPPSRRLHQTHQQQQQHQQQQPSYIQHNSNNINNINKINNNLVMPTVHVHGRDLRRQQVQRVPMRVHQTIVKKGITENQKVM